MKLIHPILLPVYLIAALVLAPTVPVFAGDTVALRLEPDATSPTIEEIDSEDERLSRAEPVMDEGKRAEGWQWLDFESTFRGYVPLESVGKDLSVAPGTLVYLRATDASPVLTTLTEEDSVDLIWASDWAEIQFTKAVPVYFRTAPAPLPAITFDPPAAPPPETASNQADTTRDTVPSAELFRYIDGILATTKKQRGSDGKYFLQLINAKGKRLAYIDSSSILVSDALDQYLNQSVTVYGTVSAEKKSGALVIEVKTIRKKR